MWTTILFLTVGMILQQCSGEKVNVQWRAYNEGRQEAKEKKRPIFIFVDTSDSLYSRIQKKEIVKNPKIVGILNRRFIPIRIDTDKDTNLVEAMRIQGFPAIVFAKFDGGLIETHVGFTDAEHLDKKLRSILEKANTSK